MEVEIAGGEKVTFISDKEGGIRAQRPGQTQAVRAVPLRDAKNKYIIYGGSGVRAQQEARRKKDIYCVRSIQRIPLSLQFNHARFQMCRGLNSKQLQVLAQLTGQNSEHLLRLCKQ